MLLPYHILLFRPLFGRSTTCCIKHACRGSTTCCFIHTYSGLWLSATDWWWSYHMLPHTIMWWLYHMLHQTVNTGRLSCIASCDLPYLNMLPHITALCTYLQWIYHMLPHAKIMCWIYHMLLHDNHIVMASSNYFRQLFIVDLPHVAQQRHPIDQPQDTSCIMHTCDEFLPPCSILQLSSVDLQVSATRLRQFLHLKNLPRVHVTLGSFVAITISTTCCLMQSFEKQI